MLQYKNNALYLEQLLVSDIADQIGTPLYLYSITQLKANYLQYQSAFAGQNALICFAVKANPNLAILKALANFGAGADCVSEGEIRKVITAGIAASKIVFSGVGKTEEELKYALAQDILQFNIESLPELHLLNSIAINANKKARVSIRINVDVDSKTHHKITTGLKSNKFGIDIELLPEVITAVTTMPAIQLQGLSVHIGSQITSLEPYKQAYSKLIAAAKTLPDKIKYLDLGGGLGVSYSQESPPSIAEYASMVRELFSSLGCKLIIEPGRSLVADIGILIARVVYIKSTSTKNFLILDAGMNDILRQSLYDAYHEIIPLLLDGGVINKYDVVGPICESSDVFAYDMALPMLKAGDLVAFKHAGAYGSSMSSSYNSRLLIPEVIVSGDKFAVTRPRPTYQDMLDLEKVPKWL